MKSDGFATSVTATNLLSFFSGIQSAVGLALLTTLLSIDTLSSTGVKMLVVSALLFLAAGVLSVLLLWTLSAIRRKGDLARFTILTPEEVMGVELDEKTRFLGLWFRRKDLLSTVLGLDCLLTLGGVFFGVACRVLWS